MNYWLPLHAIAEDDSIQEALVMFGPNGYVTVLENKETGGSDLLPLLDANTPGTLVFPVSESLKTVTRMLRASLPAGCVVADEDEEEAADGPH